MIRFKSESEEQDRIPTGGRLIGYKVLSRSRKTGGAKSRG